jgi:hypothetical protein
VAYSLTFTDRGFWSNTTALWIVEALQNYKRADPLELRVGFELVRKLQISNGLDRISARVNPSMGLQIIKDATKYN